ncbi:hypothetical protein D3C79_931900 [compost metagenome]
MRSIPSASSCATSLPQALRLPTSGYTVNHGDARQASQAFHLLMEFIKAVSMISTASITWAAAARSTAHCMPSVKRASVLSSCCS